jgi:RHS repeat-associated protein
MPHSKSLTITGGTTTGFLYDADGNRVRRTTGTTTTYYAANGSEFERTGTSGGTFTHYYTLNGQPIAYRDNSTLNWLWTDHLGSTSVTKTAAGSAVKQRYTPWGTLRTDGNLTTDNHFTGQTADQATGLAHYNARYYDPQTGRFISPDTIIPTASNGQSYNRYGYVRNNPISRVDPTGHIDRDINLDDEARAIRCGWSGVRCGAAWIAKYNIDVSNRTGGNVGTKEALAVEIGVTVGFALTPVEPIADAVACGHGFGRNWNTALDCGAILFPFWNSRTDDIAASANGVVRGSRTAARLCSFAGETGVLMADGSTKSISTIEVGDEVLAVDPETGQRGVREVEHVFLHDDILVDLSIGGEVVVTTEDHPFWNQTDRQFQRADELDDGDLLLGAGGEALAVDGLVDGTEHIGSAYNLAIETVHTYFVQVGASEVLVHNECLPVLRDWRSQLFQFGNSTFQLDKRGFTHILKRHHPKYWDGSVKEAQTFFEEHLTVSDIQGAITSVSRQNRDALRDIGAGAGQVRGVVNGTEYVLGVKNGRIGQFYPLP